MTPQVDTLYEHERGCGYRQKGGLYLTLAREEWNAKSCGKLPLHLDRCPVCSQGILPARGWTWVDADGLFLARTCRNEGGCGVCPLATRIGRAGLLWIGEKFYPHPDDWIREAQRMGISRRIPAIPNDFVLGKTWVLVAHRKAIIRRCDCCKGIRGLLPCPECSDLGTVPAAAIFHVFKPSHIEYVVADDDTQEDLERKQARGIRLVRVVPAQLRIEGLEEA